MTSSRPYLIRALYEWIVENTCTPHLIVDAVQPGVEVPRSYVRDGKIVLNVAPRAVTDLVLGNDAIAFSARFGGTPMAVSIPIAAVEGIYARENGQGMVFPAEDPEPPPASDASGATRPVPAGGPRLRVIK